MVDRISKFPYYQVVDGFRITGVFSPEAFRETLKYKPSSEDVFVVTFPKCGTTWIQQMCYLIYKDGVPPKDGQYFFTHSPFIEMMGLDAMKNLRRPTVIKSHLPYNLMPWSDEAKYLYVVRNPKDSLVSFYHHTHTALYRFTDGKFDDFFEIFLNGLNDFGDYFDHVRSWYEHQDKPNILFITYEEMKNDTHKSILKIADFLGKEYRERLEKDNNYFDDILHYSSIQYMKATVNDLLDQMFETMFLADDTDALPVPSGFKHFVKEIKKAPPPAEHEKFHLIRKGVIGYWRSVLSDDQNKRMDEKIKSKMAGTDLLKYWQSIGCLASAK